MIVGFQFRSIILLMLVVICCAVCLQITILCQASGPTLILSTDHIDLGSIESGKTKVTSFNISNGGDNTLVWSVYENIQWIDVDPTQGETTDETDTILLTINTTGLDEGNYRNSIFVKSTAWCTQIEIKFSVVQPPCGPILYYDHLIMDSAAQGGNHNGVIDAGETLNISVALRTEGSEQTTGLSAVLVTEDPLISIVGSHSEFPDLSPSSVVWTMCNYSVSVDNNLADGYVICFLLRISDAEGHCWEDNFSSIVRSEYLSEINVSPSILDFGTVVKGQGKSKNLTVSNIGNGILGWESSVTADWLSRNPKRGSTGSQPSNLVVQVTTSGLLIARYYVGNVNIVSNGGNVTVPVTVRIGTGDPNPFPGLHPRILDFGELEIGQPSIKLLRIFNCGGGTLIWDVKESIPWLGVNATTGSCTTEIDIVSITLNSSCLTPGEYSKSFHVFSTGGNMNIPVKFKGLPPNIPPTPVLNISQAQIFANESVCFDLGDSYDNDGFIVEYFFDYGDGSSSGWVETPRAYHTYPDLGNHTARFIVRDDDNTTSELTLVVEVKRRTYIPVIAYSVSKSFIKEGEDVSFSATGSYDPDGGDLVNFLFVHGDGNTSFTLSPNISHVYRFPGTYQSSVIVTDDEGENAQSTTKIIEVEQLDPLLGPLIGPTVVPYFGGCNYSLNIEIKNPSIENRSIYLELFEEEVTDPIPQENWSIGAGGVIAPTYSEILLPNSSKKDSFSVRRSFSWISPRYAVEDRLAFSDGWSFHLKSDLTTSLDRLWDSIIDADPPLYTSRCFRYHIKLTTPDLDIPEMFKTVTVKVDPATKSAFRASVLANCLASAGCCILPESAWSSIFWIISDSLHSQATVGLSNEAFANISSTIFKIPIDDERNLLGLILAILHEVNECREAAEEAAGSIGTDKREAALRVMDHAELAASRLVSLSGIMKSGLDSKSIELDRYQPGIHGNGRQLLLEQGYENEITDQLHNGLVKQHRDLESVPLEILLGHLARELINLSTLEMQQILEENMKMYGEGEIPKGLLKDINRSSLQVGLAYRSRTKGSPTRTRIEDLKSTLRGLTKNLTDPLIADFYHYVLLMELAILNDNCPPSITINTPSDGRYISVPFQVEFKVVDDIDPAPDVSTNSKRGTIISEDGYYKLWVHAWDHGGNVENISRDFVLDTTPPRIMVSFNETMISVLPEELHLDTILIYLNMTLALNSTHPPFLVELPHDKGPVEWDCRVLAFDKAGNSLEKEIVVRIPEMLNNFLEMRIFPLLMAILIACRKIGAKS